jgi:rhodanese-related sulfurtransferase
VIRARLRDAARRVALRVLGMETQAEDGGHPDSGRVTAAPYDPTVIPRVVDGSGDTPGPNHKTNIGRTWVSAQVISGTPPVLVDLRPAAEWRAGHIPGATNLPHDALEAGLDRLPAGDVRIVFYDAHDDGTADAVAHDLRARGWPGARRLVGGFAEWSAHREPVATGSAAG